MSEERRYEVDKFRISVLLDGIPAVIYLRVLLDRNKKTIRAVRHVRVMNPDGGKLPVINIGKLTQAEVDAIR